MDSTVDELADLGQGQTARLTLDGGDPIDARVNQISYVPEDHLRIELSGAGERYQLRTAADGEWAPVEIRRRDRESWVSVGIVTAVRPGETFRIVKSADMEAQAETGTER